MYRLYREQQLNCTIETAWEFFSSPHNLSQITPQSMNFVVLSESSDAISEGMEIDYTVSPVLGIPMKWKTVISQVEDYKSFTDFQKEGPYKHWNHFHEFIPNDHGVLMKDTVDYELPMGFLGKIAHQLFVKEKLKNIFDFRYRVLHQRFNNKHH
ncbi:ligand-binding SRPBCC domain-containing protein [Chryseobacterium bernardetii]|uniref:Ligand-binding SRPBCC domain-containing protein n=3 Tax=Chryseobacterium group TaxID=2782232 RepID=A0A543EIH9_9FLAO|nr:ligand-binding SRPBCC domain-containing protein [Chryseobacterium vietnamense]MDR6440955.1 ligand-binding SRPBCC domain-containing protein [Chryseobacterium bernardetii]MDR6486540.1 ligand-binding SRPBCC domain-containing protein [Chryseobacterium vietnamense]TQM21365.1 ligand-binding SRPBCC domain-containing protein [Chryseobacterium aquifrigidense]